MPLPSLAMSITGRPGRSRSLAEPSDGQLVSQVLGGDRSAEDLLYRRHLRYVAGVVIRLLQNTTEAEDVVQDTFVIALEQLPKLRDGDALRGWIVQIAVSQVRRRLRRKKLIRFLGLDGEAPDATLEALASSDASPEVVAELAMLDAVLTRLPTEQRLAWMLRHVEGQLLEEVASSCGCALTTIKRRLTAAEARVQEHFDEVRCARTDERTEVTS